jgi:hypothetical protein
MLGVMVRVGGLKSVRGWCEAVECLKGADES